VFHVINNKEENRNLANECSVSF